MLEKNLSDQFSSLNFFSLKYFFFLSFYMFADVPIDEDHIAEINEKKRYNPQLLELKPNVHLVQPSHLSNNHHHGPPHYHTSYTPLKFRPAIETNDFRPSYLTHHDESFPPSSQSKPSYKPGNVVTIKKPEVKKLKLITPGLKHYATVKHINRNDYSNYFRSRGPQEEEKRGSGQGLYRRSPRALIMYQYAPTSLNYDSYDNL